MCCIKKKYVLEFFSINVTANAKMKVYETSRVFEFKVSS